MKHNELRAKFETYWRQVGGPDLEEEFRFHPKRKWRFDYCHQSSKIAIELDGGTWIGGRHIRGAGFSRDCEKINNAQLDGWRVFRFTTDMLDNAPLQHLRPVVRLIEASK